MKTPKLNGYRRVWKFHEELIYLSLSEWNLQRITKAEFFDRIQLVKTQHISFLDLRPPDETFQWLTSLPRKELPITENNTQKLPTTTDETQPIEYCWIFLLCLKLCCQHSLLYFTEWPACDNLQSKFTNKILDFQH